MCWLCVRTAPCLLRQQLDFQPRSGDPLLIKRQPLELCVSPGAPLTFGTISPSHSGTVPLSDVARGALALTADVVTQAAVTTGALLGAVNAKGSERTGLSADRTLRGEVIGSEPAVLLRWKSCKFYKPPARREQTGHRPLLDVSMHVHITS